MLKEVKRKKKYTYKGKDVCVGYIELPKDYIGSMVRIVKKRTV